MRPAQATCSHQNPCSSVSDICFLHGVKDACGSLLVEWCGSVKVKSKALAPHAFTLQDNTRTLRCTRLSSNMNHVCSYFSLHPATVSPCLSCCHQLPFGDSVAFLDDPHHLHASMMVQVNLVGAKVDGAAQSDQGCLVLRHAGRLELLHWEVALVHLLLVLSRVHRPPILFFVEVHAWDWAPVSRSHGPQFRVIEVDLLLHVGHNLLIAKREGCTKVRQATRRAPSCPASRTCRWYNMQTLFLVLVPVGALALDTPSSARSPATSPR